METKVAQFTGEVKWFNNAKGFGFVRRDGGTDVFCHYSSLVDSGNQALKEGEQVEFDVTLGDKGPQAERAGSQHPFVGENPAPR